MGLAKFRKNKPEKDDYINVSMITNASALLDECLVNGDIGPESLYAWYLGKRSVIEQTLLDLESEYK